MSDDLIVDYRRSYIEDLLRRFNEAIAVETVIPFRIV